MKEIGVEKLKGQCAYILATMRLHQSKFLDLIHVVILVTTKSLLVTSTPYATHKPCLKEWRGRIRNMGADRHRTLEEEAKKDNPRFSEQKPLLHHYLMIH